MKQILKRIFEQITGLTIYKRLPHGQDPFKDLKFRFKDYSFNLFFDIGANIGQSISSIRKSYPDSNIWSFEPVQDTYRTLTENVTDDKVKTFQLGFGSEKSEMEIYTNKEGKGSDMFSINGVIGDKDKSSLRKEKIKIETLDSFCRDNGIEKIDYVKIDRY